MSVKENADVNTLLNSYIKDKRHTQKIPYISFIHLFSQSILQKFVYTVLFLLYLLYHNQCN